MPPARLSRAALSVIGDIVAGIATPAGSRPTRLDLSALSHPAISAARSARPASLVWAGCAAAEDRPVCSGVPRAGASAGSRRGAGGRRCRRGLAGAVGRCRGLGAAPGPRRSRLTAAEGLIGACAQAPRRQRQPARRRRRRSTIASSSNLRSESIAPVGTVDQSPAARETTSAAVRCAPCGVFTLPATPRLRTAPAPKSGATSAVSRRRCTSRSARNRSRLIRADDRRHAALHARHVALGPAEADEPGRVVDMDVAEKRRRARRLFQIFVAGAEIGMRRRDRGLPRPAAAGSGRATAGFRRRNRRVRGGPAGRRNSRCRRSRNRSGTPRRPPAPRSRRPPRRADRHGAARCRWKFANRSTRSIASAGAVEPARRKRIAWCQRTSSGRSP